ncbi:MAG: helix-turn-helix transcriptional regulator [Clostridia bacterium]
MNLQEMEAVLLKDEETKAEYEVLAPEYELIKAVLNARKTAKLTQQQLADKAGVDRADISKLENGNANPTFNMLQRLAESMNMSIKLEFVPKIRNKIQSLSDESEKL